MLRETVIDMACDEGLRIRLGENLKRYLEEVVSWEVVAQQYHQAMNWPGISGYWKPVELLLEF